MMAQSDLSFDCSLAKAVRAFTSLSYAQSVKGKLNETSNLFYSPVSIAMALAALYQGAKGNTASQIEKVFGLSKEEAAALPADIKKFLSKIQVSKPDEQGSQLQLANALALQNDYSVETAFKTTLESLFNSALINVDFVNDTESARRTINVWVAGKTAQEITDLLPEGVLDSLTRLVIVNAVRFDAKWLNSFDEAATRNDTFAQLTSDRATMPVRMMTRNKTKLLYWSNIANADQPDEKPLYSDTVQLSVVALPYSSGSDESLEMLILLPEKRDGLIQLESLIANTPDSFDRLLTAFHDNARRRDVYVHLPSFRFEEELALADLLKQLGVTDMFNESADLNGIVNGGQLYIAAALHRAVIDVDEKGTRAAAATAMVANTRCMVIPEPTIDFVVDHPCVFVLYASSLRVPLFIGRLAQPKRA